MDSGTRIITSLLFIAFIGVSNADDRAAMAYYEKGDYAQAAVLFDDISWKAIALAKSDQLRGAQLLLSRLDDVDALYNLGLVYANQGLLSLALDAFQQVLELEPEAEDARHNADIIAAILVNRAQDGSGGSSSKKESQQINDANEGEGSGSGASGEERSNSEQQGADKGQSSDIQDPTGGQDSADSARQSGQHNSAHSSALEGEVGEFESQSLRSAIASDNFEEDKDNENHSEKSISRDVADQAMTQWFNRIQHNQAQFLRERLELMSLSRRNILGEEEVR